LQNFFEFFSENMLEKKAMEPGRQREREDMEQVRVITNSLKNF
jgi:hypothetical protein